MESEIFVYKLQRIVLLNVRFIIQNYQSRIFLEKHGPIYDARYKKSEAKKREKKNESNHKRRIKIDSVEYIILRRVLLRKKRQMYASCIYVCLHWPSPEHFINKREKSSTKMELLICRSRWKQSSLKWLEPI